MVRHVGVTRVEAAKNFKGECRAFISYKALNKYYEDYLDDAIRLSDPQTPQDPHELERVRTACVKSYLL